MFFPHPEHFKKKVIHFLFRFHPFQEKRSFERFVGDSMNAASVWVSVYVIILINIMFVFKKRSQWPALNKNIEQ